MADVSSPIHAVWTPKGAQRESAEILANEDGSNGEQRLLPMRDMNVTTATGQDMNVTAATGENVIPLKFKGKGSKYKSSKNVDGDGDDSNGVNR